MRIVESIRTFRANRRTWKAYRRHILDTWAKPGFNAINYRGMPVDSDVIQPTVNLAFPEQIKFGPDTTNDSGISDSLDQLNKQLEVNEPLAPNPSPSQGLVGAVDMRAAKMSAINKKLGAL